MSLTIWQVDAFSDRPFGGNPAAVCILDAARDETWMQHVALEMNLSETAFLVRRDDGSFDLRWFTPAVEVKLCGHATVASAHILWQEGFLQPGEQARFHTLSGALTADQRDGWIELDFPAHTLTPHEPSAELLEALGAAAVNVQRDGGDLVVELESEAAVRGLTPDLRVIATAAERGVMVTARASTAPYDFVSRFFAPAAGVDEDPVTGSSFSALAPYWAPRLGKEELLAYQASKRGGVVRCRLAGDRVKIAGQAVTVMRAELVD